MAKAKKKFIIKNHQKRNRYLFLLLFCFLMLGIGYSNIISSLGINSTVLFRKYNTYLLYDVMKEAANTTTYARKYTGAHQDSYAGTGTQDIYHWYGTSSTASTIKNKNNVIFANHCWQMIRTTDTGGVKMIYNGESVNNQCLSNRGNHLGYGYLATQDLGTEYYYGTSYEYNESTNLFSLTGVLVKKTFNASTEAELIGKYTCKSPLEAGTCSTIYLVVREEERTEANVLPISKNAHYSQFGESAYNALHDIYSVGYMYNRIYRSSSISSQTFSITSRSWSINSYRSYSDTVTYNEQNGKYYLVNPQGISTLSDYSELVGKYILDQSGASASPTVLYVLMVSGSLVYNRSLSGGDLDTSITVGDSYTESGGIYTLTNPVNISFIDWYNNVSDYTVYKGKYACKGNNTSCSEIMHIHPRATPNKDSFYYDGPTRTYSFSEGISYDNGTYTLTGDIKNIWDFYDNDDINKTVLLTHHYTCFENGTSCTEAGYINHFNNTSYPRIIYLLLRDGKDVMGAINDMLYANDVNVKNSVIKLAVDKWYEHYLTNYDVYLEDTVFCNDRTIQELGAFNSNGGVMHDYNTSVHDYELLFQQYDKGTDSLSCDRETDMFSTLNPSAQLTYKVGLVSAPELNLLHYSSVFNTGQNYWTISPRTYYADNTNIIISYRSLGISNGDIKNPIGVRPVISLKPGTKYSTGSGSMADPYIVDVPAGTLSLNKSNVSFRNPGGSDTLVATTNLQEPIIWESSNPNVVTVDSNGNITAVDYGVASVTAKVGIMSASTVVSVLIPFEYDSWSTIIQNVRNNNTSDYNVGDTRLIDLGSLGIHPIRISNMSSPSECNNTGYSQTACGFVLEFTDVITKRVMNTSNTNVGGWPSTTLRTYLNDTFYNAIPEDLRQGIIDTTVLSGHGSTTGEENFTSTDKIYLLSMVEVYAEAYAYDSIKETDTRQLDYYHQKEVGVVFNSDSIKKSGDTNCDWRLRSAYSENTTNYTYISMWGERKYGTATATYGISPAFRIG